MGMSQPIASYKNHRFPPEIIARAVWLYDRKEAFREVIMDCVKSRLSSKLADTEQVIEKLDALVGNAALSWTPTMHQTQ